jgi:hypothetical protein
MYLGSFSHSSLQILSSYVRLDGERYSYFQLSPEMFDGVQVQALAGLLKPLLHCLGCVLKIVVLLEGEPSAQSEVLSALEQVFIKDLCTLFSSSVPLS